MFDLDTGKFVIRDGVELYPGMTRETFFKSSLYQTELLRDSDRQDLGKYNYSIKPQTIDGFEMSVDIYVSDYGYVDKIELTRPDFYDWPHWPSNIKEADYAYDIKRYNDRFLEHQLQESVREANELSYSYEWGSLTSSINLRHTPHVMITIRYKETPFLKARGITFDHIDIFENGPAN
ncbi:hypothetical protein [Paenibacillus vini]|uniref:Uncharacterized protein n=1 Tax=Paenibacillus vini TaxID=1476024 RepID=A0ABQ4MAG3_9BACL|nr:hypothetical protein [Paenibacillus vini]GIP52984.1 hypothetical protein J42TS3_20190 [Paenibacillus vini]